ncbi:MAG: hypothetical protein ACOX7Q_08705 [Kiritimatiellia bacterium]
MHASPALPPDELRDVAIHVWWAWDSEWQKVARVDAEDGVLWFQGRVNRDFFMWPKWCPRFTIENMPYRNGTRRASGFWIEKRASFSTSRARAKGPKPHSRQYLS